MVSANQINGVENMRDRPDAPKTISEVEEKVKKYWNKIGDQMSAIENGKVTPR